LAHEVAGTAELWDAMTQAAEGDSMKTQKVGSFKFDVEYESAEQKQRTGYVIVRRLDNTYVGKLVADQAQDLICELLGARQKAKRSK
jgi:hypothetical protein